MTNSTITSTTAPSNTIKVKAGTERLTARVTAKLKDLTTENAKALGKTVSRHLNDLINRENKRIITDAYLACTPIYTPNTETSTSKAENAAYSVEPGEEMEAAKNTAIFMLGLDYDITEENESIHIANLPIMKAQAQITKKVSFEALNEDLQNFITDVKKAYSIPNLPCSISCYLDLDIDPITRKQVLSLEIKYAGIFHPEVFKGINSRLEVRGFQPMAQTSSFIYANAIISQL